MKPMDTDTRNDDLVASYSSRGPTTVDGIIKPDIVAPGNETISVLSPGSTLAGEYPGNIVPPSSYGLSGAPAYLTLNGTSMAAPVVSATAALLISREPGITPDTIKARLMKTAYKVFPAQSTVVDRRRFLHRLLRRSHDWGRVSGYRRRTGGPRYGNQAGAVAESELRALHRSAFT